MEIRPSKKQTEPAFLTFLEAVERIGFRLKTSRNWLDTGKFPLPTHKINGMVMVPVVAVDVYIDAVIESSLTNLPPEVAEFFRVEIKARKQAQPTPEASLKVKGKPGRKVRGGVS